MTADRFFLGLDLGQSMDHSALVALRRRPMRDPVDPERTLFRYTVRGVKRWPLGTLYTVVVKEVAELVSKPPLKGCVLGLDATGVGAPVVEMVYGQKPAATIRPVLITSGYNVGGDPSCYHVPKRDLVAAVSVLLQSGRLEIPQSIPESALLVKELQTLRAKITAAGNESFEADWREQAHDDLVLALAIAAWLGEKSPDAYTGPLVLWPPSQEQVAAERYLRLVKEAVAAGDKNEVVRLAMLVLRMPGIFEDTRDDVRSIAVDCGCQLPEVEPVSPDLTVDESDRVKFAGMDVDFREPELWGTR